MTLIYTMTKGSFTFLLFLCIPSPVLLSMVRVIGTSLQQAVRSPAVIAYSRLGSAHRSVGGVKVEAGAKRTPQVNF